MDPAIVAPLFQQGITGVVAVILLFVCRTLWQENKALQAARIEDAEKRVEDTKQAAASVNAALRTIETAVALIQQQARK